MAYIETRTLSMRKDRQKIHAVEPVYLRQGDCGAIIEGLLEDNGQPFEMGDTNSTDVVFKAMNSGGNYIIEDTENRSDTENAQAIVKYVVSSALTAKHGKAFVAYFEVRQGKSTDKDGNVSYTDIYTSDAIPLVIYKNVDISGDAAEEYQNYLDELIKEAEELIAKMEGGGFEGTAGNSSTPVWIDEGIAKPISGSIGSTSRGVYVNSSGSLTSLSASVGSKALPVFVSSGTTTVCDSSLAVSITGNAASATQADSAASATNASAADKLNCENVGDTSTPVYFEGGIPVKCTEISGGGSGDSADKLTHARTISLTGDVSAAVEFGGSEDVSSTATLASTGITAGNYGPTSNQSPNAGETITVPYITFDAKGRATAAANRTITLPSAQGETGTADKLSCGNVGGTNAPVYFSDGVPKVLGTIGNAATPIYLDNGVLKECTELAMVTGLYLSDISLSNEWVASPGDSTTVTLTITNAGDDATNVTVKVANLDDDGDPDTHAAPDTSVISSINHGSSRTASFEIIAGSLFDSRTYFDVEISADGCATFLYKNAFKLDVGS